MRVRALGKLSHLLPCGSLNGSVVYTLYFLECVQTALASADIIHWFSKGWGQLSVLSDPYVNPIDLPIMAGLIAMIVQLYFTWRIWILSASLPLAVFIGAISVAQCVAGFVAGIQVIFSRFSFQCLLN